MNKSIVLNICGVKSLGGLKVAKTAIESVQESQYNLILLHNNNLPELSSRNTDFINIETNLKRFLHPYLNLFLSKENIYKINNSEAIIHLGNFGFKTKNKSYTMIQNLLPFEETNIKNIILKFFINKSFKQSSFIIYQLDHVAKKINKRFHPKLIGIGEVKKIKKSYNKEIGVISIQSNIKNKNTAFLNKVLGIIESEFPNLKITKVVSQENINQTDSKSEKFINSLLEHNIYLHASNYETVGLPIYEASSNGLFVVGPELEYMNNFDNTNSIKYIPGNISSAVNAIKEVLNINLKTYDGLTYTENWDEILKKL